MVVTQLDRLARSTLHLCQIVEKLKGKQVQLQTISQKTIESKQLKTDEY
ncbi:MAG: recombinase family protein [Candidatus Poribacteria bacterium]|nr:recombinase family protein [Candidatus Poribacteria bacterium]MDP6747011.1 recombinase family protein [Candidatus Poribacteria bacterium]MDP6997160.1 recombinase family protein [Candidatus Poribacteria bacterium]